MVRFASDELRQKIRHAPKSPGCYLFYDSMDNCIYVGKSKLLNARVRSYFTDSAIEDIRIGKLVREIKDVEYRITTTELDALIEEYLLIKQHKPWFNAQHRRDVKLFYLHVNCRLPYPTISITEGKPASSRDCYGAFRDIHDAQEAIELLSQAWHTPHCGRSSFSDVRRPCTYHETKQCLAPCCQVIDMAAYQAQIKDMILLLRGKCPRAFARLDAEMREASVACNFEQAQKMKLLIEKLERLRRRCGHHFRIAAGTNAMLFMRGHAEETLSAFYIREGRVLFRVYVPPDAAPQETVDTLLKKSQENEDAYADVPLMTQCLNEIFSVKQLVPIRKRDTDHVLREKLSTVIQGMRENKGN